MIRSGLNPLLLFSLLWLSGCQMMEFKRNMPAPPSEEILSSVRHLEAKGRYGQAIELLEQAIRQDGKAEVYTSALRKLRLQQKIVEQELQDQLLISKTAALKNQVPILEQLIRANPDDRQYQRHLDEVHSSLNTLRQSLSECGWRHFRKNNALSRDCLTLSLSLEDSERDQQLMDYLLKEQQENLARTERAQRAKREITWKTRNQKRLEKAEQLYQYSRLTEARELLELVIKEDPKNPVAQEMLTKVEQRLNRYQENLLAAGDRLYREGEIQGAIAIWRAALTLDPEDPRTREKIDRAQRVLENLENLRRSNTNSP